MCGIFAWAGKNPKQFDKTQLNVLGIFNEKRGEHSCGIAIDGDINIGIDKNKVYRDFLAHSGYDSPRKLPTVIGHTRHATFGAHTVENAHPFGFGMHKDHYEFVGVHNGSLLNHEDLAKQYDIDTLAVKSSETQSNFMRRTKIDSEVLLEIIYNENNYNVLSEYNGAAALVFTNTKEPNVTYCYHGKSRKTDYLAENAAIEERPLYYYQESATSLYISSIESSLFAIGGTVDTVGEFDHNTVYKITDGNIKDAETTVISRKGRFQSGNKYIPSTYKHKSCSHHARFQEDEDRYARHSSASRRDRTSVNASSKEGKKLLAANIYKDTPVKLVNSYGNKIYMNKLRYWRTGHTITGIYTWIDTHGFYFLGETEKEADNKFFDLVNKVFYGQDFVTDPSKLTGLAKKNAFTPFVSTADNEITEALKFYMLDGVRVKTQLDYHQCLDLIKTAPAVIDWSALSHCSTHPVIDIEATSKRFDSQEILLLDVPFTGIICPLGSEKVYTITNGNCTEILELTTPAMSIVHDLTTVKKDLEEHEEDQIKKSSQTALQLIEEEADLDRLEDDIEEMFKDSLRRFPGYIKRLKKYNKVDRGAEALEIMDSFITDAQKLITIDTKD